MYPGKKSASRHKTLETFQETGERRCWELAGVGQVGQKLQLPEDSSRKLSYVWGPSHLLRILCGEELGFGRWYNGSTCRAAWLPDHNPCLSHKAIWAGRGCLTQILVTDMDPQQSHPSRVATQRERKTCYQTKLKPAEPTPFLT